MAYNHDFELAQAVEDHFTNDQDPLEYLHELENYREWQETEKAKYAFLDDDEEIEFE